MPPNSNELKTRQFIFLFLLAFALAGRSVPAFACQSNAGDTIEKKHFLDMKGKITFGKKALPQVFVRVFADSSYAVVKKIESDIEGWLAFQLPIQKMYVIQISKPGYITKIITVDTHMPKSHNNGDYYFEFSVDLFEAIEGLDVSMLKDPIAKIFFNTFTKNFDYDYNYTAKINADVKKLYKDYELLKKENKNKKGTDKKEEKGNSTDLKKDNSADSKSAVKNAQKIFFSIEVLSSKEQLPRNSPLLKGMLNVNEYKEGDVYKYSVGEYVLRADAEKMKNVILRDFPDANIISVAEGKKFDEDPTDKPNKGK